MSALTRIGVDQIGSTGPQLFELGHRAVLGVLALAALLITANYVVIVVNSLGIVSLIHVSLRSIFMLGRFYVGLP